MLNTFVSYSWDVEHGTGIVAELEKHCQSRNIRLLRDNNEIKHGELIQQFMDKLTGGEHVITVFSKPYFQSPWCMYELLKTWQKGDFEQRTHPIIADDCDLQDAFYRIGVVKHWVAEHEKIRQLLDGQDASLFVEEFKKANMLRDISQNANELMNFAAGRLTTPLKQLKAKQYAQLLDPICPLYEIPNTAIFHPAQSDKDFMAAIRLRMVASLRHSSILRKALVEQLKLNGTAETADKLADILVKRCADEDTLGHLLRNDIFRATRLSLQALPRSPDKDSATIIKEIDQLTSSADTLFSCLVLYAIRADWMDKYCQGCVSAGSNLRHMPFETITAVEIVTSRHLQRIPTFSLTSSDAVGKEGFVVPEHGFEKDDIVTGILRQVWVKVFPEDLPENYQESKLRRLGSQIRNRHQRQDEEKNNYYCIVSGDSNHPLSDPDVRAELMRKLPDLPLIILRTEDCQDVLVIPDDADLASLIFDFYQMLNKYRPYEPDKDH
jgi:hypothetical protein